MLDVSEVEWVLEALKGAYEELSALEADSDWYVTTGKLMEQLESAIDMLEERLDG